jgi:transcriptional regulator with XRE-family HTH domain
LVSAEVIWDGHQAPALFQVPPIRRWDEPAETATLPGMSSYNPFAQVEPKQATVSSRIREERERRVWTQEKLADMVGVTEQTISRYERTRPPKMPMLLKIAAAMGMDVHDLIPGDRPADPEERALVEWFRQAPRDDRSRVVRLARSLYEARVSERESEAFETRPGRQG